MKRQARIEGDVVEVPLGAGRRAYGRLLVEPIVEFYDIEFRDDEPADIEAITNSPVAFTIYVMNSAITSGRWSRVGEKPLTDDERNKPIRFCKQDPITGALSIYWEDLRSGEVHEVRASLRECEQLETAAVWSAEHVEDRLRDHFDGQPNKWVESLRAR